MTGITGFTRDELHAIEQAVEGRLDRLETDGDESYRDEIVTLYHVEQKVQAALAETEDEDADG